MQRGYKIGERVVRPAIVVVSAGPGPEEGAAKDAPAAEQADSAA